MSLVLPLSPSLTFSLQRWSWMALDGSLLISFQTYQSQEKKCRFFWWLVQGYYAEILAESLITCPSFTIVLLKAYIFYLCQTIAVVIGSGFAPPDSRQMGFLQERRILLVKGGGERVLKKPNMFPQSCSSDDILWCFWGKVLTDSYFRYQSKMSFPHTGVAFFY